MPKVTKFPRFRSHIRKNKAGEVKTYYFYDRRPEGETDVALGTNYAEAIKQWASLCSHTAPAKGRVQEAIDRWREFELPQYSNVETQKSYRRQLANVEAVLGQMIWPEVTLPILREYLDRRVSRVEGKKVRASTQGNREMSVLSIVWNKARLWGMTQLHWPAQGVKNWKNEEAARQFEVTDQLFDAVYAEAEPVLRDAMDIATSTGMRLTDVRTVRLPAGDVMRLKASKTGKEADFDLSASNVFPGLVARRRAISTDHSMLLSTEDGLQVTVSMLRGSWDRARLAAQAKHPELAGQIRSMYLRDMRKRASDLASDINQASGLLQHSNVSLTEKHYRTKVAKLNPVR